MSWPWWVLGAVVFGIVLDRVAVWAEERGWIYWRRRSPDPRGGGGPLGEVFEIFAPSRQHLIAERDRQRLTIAQAETDEPQPDIDLDAGTARVWAPPPREPRVRWAGPASTVGEGRARPTARASTLGPHR